MNQPLAELVWYSPQLLPLAVVAAALISGAVLWLYAGQVRLLSRPWRWILPGLRITALAALLISILRPVAVRPRGVDEQAAIVLLIDRSLSMSAHDFDFVQRGHPAGDAGGEPAHVRRGAGEARLVAVADALGLLPPGARDTKLGVISTDLQRLASLLEDLNRARSERDYAQLAGRGGDIAVQREQQAQASLQSAADDLEREVAAAPQSARLEEIAESFRRVAASASSPAQARDAAQLLNQGREAINAAQVDDDRNLYQRRSDVRDACDRIAEFTRDDLIAAALTGNIPGAGATGVGNAPASGNVTDAVATPGNGLLAHFPTGAPIFAYTFGSEVAPLPVRGGGGPVATLALSPDADSTDIVGAVRTAIDQLKGVTLAGVVVLSDGRQVGGDQDTVLDATQSDVPIFGVIVGAQRTALRDVAIAKVLFPPSPMKGETITVHVELAHSGYVGAAVKVHCHLDGADEQIKTVPLTDAATAATEFTFKLDQTGVRQLKISAESLPGEASIDNNVALRQVKVLADKINVGIYSSAPGWDYQYIHNALARTPWVQLDDAVLDKRKLPLTPDQILQKNVIILDDVAVDALDPSQWDAIHTLISQRGGSAILIAGDAHLPAEYAQNVLAAPLLPYEAGLRPAFRTWPGKEPNFHIVPVPGAGDVDALKLDDGADTLSRWDELPPLFRYLPIGQLKPNARPLLIDRDSNAIVLTESRLGLGRVFFCGINETWRWRLKVGDRDQDRFWLQLIRYAGDDPYTSKTKTAWLDADQTSAQPGQTVHVKARMFTDDGTPASDLHSAVQVWKGNQLIGVEALAPASRDGDGRYVGAVSDLPAGQYELRLTGPGGDQTDYARVPLTIAPDDEAEMADLSASDQPLRGLADATGGTVIPLERIRSLPELISHAQSRKTRVAEHPLWDSYYLFLFVLACFGAEWALRKHVGLL
jgi:hypothetical protein